MCILGDIMKGFLYGKTEYNILASATRLDDYINYAKNNNFDYLSITDSNMQIRIII